MPYGGRSAAQIRLIAQQNLDFAQSFGVKAIIAACGTVSSNASHILEGYPLPVCGVLKPGIEAMARVPGRAPLGIIATAASIKAGAFRRALTEKAPGRQIIDLPCPDFVPLIESGHTRPEDPALRRAVEEALAPVKAAGAGALLLGCTHYGIISDAIRDYLGPEVALVSASDCVAEKTCRKLEALGLTGGSGETRYYTSGDAAAFSAAASALLGQEIHAEHVPAMEI